MKRNYPKNVINTGRFKKGNDVGYHQGFLGKKHTEITKKKMSIGISKPKIEKVCPECGEKFKVSPSQDITIYCSRSCFGKSKRGENHCCWQGGKSFEPYPPDWIEDLREVIRKRDKYTCQICEIHQDELEGRFKKLAVHHIDYNKNNLSPENLISLCKGCHSKTNFNRDYWTRYFYEQL